MTTEQPKIYTKTGDDGTTGLFYGGRVEKNSAAPSAYGSVDEAQAAIGIARATTEPGGELDTMLIALMRDLYVAMAELATDPSNHHKLTDGASRMTAPMVTTLEGHIDDALARFSMPTEFTIPGNNPTSAALDFARTVVRRAERASLGVAAVDGHVISYLNRLSDLLWALARAAEAGEALQAKAPG